MKFTATQAQLREVAALAYNASLPMGMGYLHYEPGDVKGTDLGHIKVADGLNFDYVQGRMIKLNVWAEGDGVYSVRDDDPRTDYQSWARRYPTYRALLEAAGIEIEVAA